MQKALDWPEREGSRKCFICGPENSKGLHLKFFKLDEDAVTTEFYPPQEWSGWDGLMHGGLQCALLDEITAWAVSTLKGRVYFVTIGLEVRYRRPVRLDQKLTLIGRILKETGRGSRVLGRILDRKGRVLSEAESTVLHVDRERFQKLMASS
ncbi:MAG: PaaI family thioesterase [Pseudomonadota bacterium]